MLHFVPAPIGNLEDITFRSLRLLESAKIILCEDTRVTKRLLHLLKTKHEINPQVEQFISLHSHNEKEILKELSPSMFDDIVLYVSDAGMPAVSDPGCALVKYCQEHDVAYDVLPGANAALLAYASSGFCDTQFLFFGFLPHKGRDRQDKLREALFNGYVTIIYESPHRVLKLIDQICEIAPEKELFLIKEATKLHQKTFRGTAEEIQSTMKAQNIKGEWVVVVKADKKEIGTITVDEILKLDIPKKQAAKMIAKITGKSPKECYNNLL
ncbi:MAG TPA: 16S rRNA (cytidine(1402)-2'-O)-methyltransferase [Campylobacterales bacterium]|nr:16S rRNA (cytidine(1402)-2'-O)-methyltransferase [Campylobacterales bacterium]